MKLKIRKLSLYFSAGALGGLTNSLAVWFCGLSGINELVGVTIAPTLSPAWLYPRIVWGGIWGCIFFFVKTQKTISISKAFLVSLAPSLVQLLIVFPFKASKGYLGLELGVMTPVMVLIFNFVWGITAISVLRVSTETES